MTQCAHNLTELARAAEVIRDAALGAAGDDPDDRVCCWADDRRGGQDRVTETRISTAGHDDGHVIAVPLRGEVAQHIGLWGPNAALAVADWLEATADLHEPKPDLAGAADACGCALSSCQWCNDEDSPCADVRHALAVASEILGTKHRQLRAARTEAEARAANLALAGKER